MTGEQYSPPPPSLPVPPNHPNEHGYLPAPPLAGQSYFAVQPEPAAAPSWDRASPRRIAAITLWVVLALLSAGIPYLRFNGWSTTGAGRSGNQVTADGWGRYDSLAARIAGHDTVYGYAFAVAAVVLVSAAVLLLWRPAAAWGGILALMGSTFLFAIVCLLGLDVASRRSYNYVRADGTYTATVGPGVWLALVTGLGAAAGILLAIDVLLYSRGDRIAPAGHPSAYPGRLPAGYPSEHPASTPAGSAPTGEPAFRQDWTG
ncbi:hypothetical protein SAMN05892883_0736 [Jatrophihabitans sp. GAS493]|uniref:hypothetical protein n=1 Tax=Jatrophihabitans sp. GAS493 TaxID=1907575 RepID=UPI000BB813C1|nr:hypothetical protein [Jatrophihabitans sp. GAS493]SOD71161.1 hypothetical protein SAMN05892883_0736 [Jatrophihabitans sp. GAS493]